MSRYQRRKGAEKEQEAARLWRQAGFPEARRNLSQYQTRSGRDLVGTGAFLVQCKAGERINVWAALREAEAAAGEGSVPLAMVKKDRGEWVIVIRWRDFETLLKTHDGTGEQTR